MSSSAIPPAPISPGVGVRRKPKTLPKLPISAFSPPNSGTSEKFPLPASPSTVHPENVVDANVAVNDGDYSLSTWKREAGQVLGGRIGGVVLKIVDNDVQSVVTKINTSGAKELILCAAFPFHLQGSQPSIPKDLQVPFSLSTVYSKSTSAASNNLKWALQQGRPVDIDIQVVIDDQIFEDFEDTLSKATDTDRVPPIIISNTLPPPNDLDLPLVKLMNHPTYRAYQARTAALSLFPDVYIKFLPPNWDLIAPESALPDAELRDSKEKREWKKRIKMYLGPVLEAFGYQRIIFGSSPSTTSSLGSHAGDWYEIARESLAELGVEQEAIDAVFYQTAKRVYGA